MGDPRISIASDIDGVIANVLPLMRHFIFRDFNFDIHPMGRHNVDVPGLGHKEATLFIRNLIRKYSDNIYPYSGAVDGYEKIYRITNEPITFVTARDESIADVTIKWLQKYMTVPFNVYFMPSMDKPSFLVNNQIAFWIDDRLKIVNSCPSEIVVFMIKRSWNVSREINSNVIPVRDVLHASSIWRKTIEGRVLQ